MFLKKFYFSLLVFLLGFFMAEATHLKGGEITVKRISDKTLTYEFTLTTYTENNRANQDQTEVNFCFGDGSTIYKARRCCGTPTDIGNGTLKNLYKIEYTYPAPALFYKVSVAIPNRNDNVRNITRSVEVPFYVETIFSINSGLGQNSTPLLLNPAVDLTAVIGQPFIHNANAVDAEGDSLAYRLSSSRTGDFETCSATSRGILAPGFRQPNEVSSVPSSFTINPLSGDLIWDSPQELGLYNCAFIVEEWRNGVKISETVRDMQIEVKDVDNKGPKLTVPPDVCVQAGAFLNETISAVDVPSKTGRIDPLTIYSFGNVYAIDTVYAVKQPYATFSTSPKQVSTPAYGYFKWQTACQHIRKEPYDIFFKVEDNPPITVGGGVKLVDSKIWKVRVIAPAIKGLKATVLTEGNKASLTWSSYPCALVGAKIMIYRKQGACTPVVNKLCQTGMTLSGFTEIARVDITKTAYEDAGLLKNSNYTYVLVVVFTNSKGIEDFSPMSESACVFIPTSAPLMTNVSVRKTDATAGELFVRWTRPLKLDTVVYPGPYQYVVNRADGLNGSNFVPTGTPISKDTFMTDKGLNTASNAYRYKVDFYYTLNKQFKLLDSPSPASSVVLQGQAAVKSVKLAWVANVPWSNDYQVHRVYRESSKGSGKFNQIAEVSVAGSNSYTFTDQGTDFYTKDGKLDVTISPDSTYCYYVETLGTYGEGLPTLALLNSSQTVCVKPQSDVNPCAPKLTLAPPACDLLDKDPTCNTTSFENSLTWVPTLTGNCDQSLASYRIYYSKDGSNFKMLSEVNALKYVHKKSDSFIGCYYVTAVSQLGKESPKSETFCQDNCPSFELPNIFSPNGDGKNDFFLAMRCPRFVTQVSCKIVDRNGQLVYEYQGDVAGFGWNGKDMNGNVMSPSTYFYTCEVAFDVVNQALKSKTLKGWVELVK